MLVFMHERLPHQSEELFHQARATVDHDLGCIVEDIVSHHV
jgi:hypothetical protein